MPTVDPITDEQERIRRLFGGDPTANLPVWRDYLAQRQTQPSVTPQPYNDFSYKGSFASTNLKPPQQKFDAIRSRFADILAMSPPIYRRQQTGGVGFNYSGMYKGNDARSRVLRAISGVAGTPYSWGGGGYKGASYGIGRGANTKGFDCSGLVQYAYAQIGWRMPRLAQQQATLGRRTSIGHLRPGDLVAGPGHIAVYAGNGMMWEAPRTGLRVRLTRVRSGMVGVALNY